MKTAILISGEYRTFDIAVHSMKFLADPSVDVYVSTWNTSNMENTSLGISITEHITADRVIAALGKVALAGLIIDESKYDYPWKYNSKMIYRWQRGLEMIKSSGIEYDKIFIIRPDIYFEYSLYGFFQQASDFSTLSPMVLYTGWHLPEKKHFDDMTIVGSPQTVYNALMGIDITGWNSSCHSADWHLWAWENMTRRGIPMGRISPGISITFCRGNCTIDDNTPEKVDYKSKLWQYANIEKLCKEVGEVRTKQIWHDGIFNDIAAFRKIPPP